MEGQAVKTYQVKLYHLYKYLGFSDYDLLNFVEDTMNNPYADTYKRYQEIDEFHLVYFNQTDEGPVVNTNCKDKQVAIQRFKDVLIPLTETATTDPVDEYLLESMLDYNTKELVRG